MPAPLEGIDWSVAKAMCAAGMGKPEVASKLGVSLDTLKKRARREQWVCTNAILHKARQSQRQSIKALQDDPKVSPLLVPQVPKTGQNEGNGAKTGALSLSFRNESEQKSGALLLKTLESNDQKSSLLASAMALRSIEAADKDETPLPLKTLQDLDKALMISKRAAGKDRDEQGVTVNLFSPQAGARPSETARNFRVRVQEAETVAIAQEAT